jgi:hypothetical protein
MGQTSLFSVANRALLDDTAMKQEAVINNTFRMVPFCDCSPLTANPGLLPNNLRHFYAPKILKSRYR